MIGRRLSHYEIVEEISRGGMGVVYRAHDVNLVRDVALKVLPDDLVHDAERRERLLQEARAASALEHPHIGVIHEVGEADGVTFIAMELIRGEKLSAVLSRGPLPPPRALTLATEIAEGLARAHEMGVVHRDLKPANVMVTADGHAKIIDFGLAKLVEPAQQDVATVSVHGPRTGPGVVLGTAAYMSPEQARGGRIDHRSDIFALGVTLFEMITGRPAFQGQSSLDTLQAILTQPVPPLPALAGSSGETTAELHRIIGKATEKDPEDRFQGMKDLIVDLRAARRRLESAPTSVVTPVSGPRVSPATRRGGRAGVALAAVLALAVVAAAAVWWWVGRRSSGPAVNPSGKPAVAVLYFENNTGDPSLDWMRTGLTDMLVTDLSQSAEFEVLGTDRLVQILQELRRTDDRVLPADVVQEIADRAAVDRVVVGSYVKAGGTIRISARLQDARTGRIVSAERVEGPGEASLFGLVDELTRRFRERIAAAGGFVSAPLVKRPGEAPVEAGLDRGVTDITTSSIEAYRYYAEGISFHERSLPSQAAPLLEKAIEIDPGFAMAYAKLAVVHNNLVSLDKRDEYAKRALDLTDRLTTRERYYIEGFYYGLRPETRARSIEAYQQGLRLHPEHQASRHNLALHLAALERYPEGIEQYEELLRRGTSNPTSYENLADILIQTGNIRRAREVADQFVVRYPDSAAGLRMLGMTFVAEQRLDEARAAFEKAEALNPLDFGARYGRHLVASLQLRWADAEAISEELLRFPAPFPRFLASMGRCSVAAARGRSQAADEWSERAARVAGLSPLPRAISRNRLALKLLRQGKAGAALAQAELALADARDRDGEFETLQVLAVAQAAAGRPADAAKTLGFLESRVKILPSEREVRRVHWARGEIAMLRGDAATGAGELSKAAAMLPVHGPPTGPPPSHGELWYAAAVANMKAGRDAEAAQMLERLQSGHERAFAMEVWARSFFLLGQIYERRGDHARARDQYTRFLDLWRDGDMERGWVEEARRKVG
jgi:tetratricopeptide (TPR) repeat protein/TolB-like protein/predicted Ser/Thr protein kinase